MRYVLIATALAWSVMGCQAPEAIGEPSETVDAGAPPARRVEVRVVTPRTFIERVDVAAVVATEHDVVVSAQGAGTVMERLDRGTRVKAKQVVARLDPTLATAQLRQARAGVRVAESGLALSRDRLERQRPLHAEGIISGLEFRQLEAAVAQGEAGVEQAKGLRSAAEEQRKRLVVRAPFDGVVEAALVELGAQVVPGQPIARVVDRAEVRIRAGVPERYARDIKLGAKVRVTFQAYGLAPRDGEVNFVGGTIDRASRTFSVEVALKNADGALKPEMVARVALVRAEHEAVLVVPLDAVLRDEQGATVFVEQGGAVHRERVVLGARTGGEVVVREGLKPGARVVVLGQGSVSEGDLVKATVRATRPALTP